MEQEGNVSKTMDELIMLSVNTTMSP